VPHGKKELDFMMSVSLIFLGGIAVLVILIIAVVMMNR